MAKFMDVHNGFFGVTQAQLFKSNPDGMFADWNPNSTCRGTGDNGG
jgi:hypothetical protein